ncbi:RNB-domain-containing protein [Sistotremastrum suecicum HHB10207 ss-3]|uniref:RNB-domain-containing protein n=1 Tax=Sistotremastrum suecicum HHB10207 ss-3 TaxID=1314776 RepID=A0A166EWF7_9AGAM|nr:RNB-domain-containing protein [Sistotremastrum suecicum HHB10207 ss-3]
MLQRGLTAARSCHTRPLPYISSASCKHNAVGQTRSATSASTLVNKLDDLTKRLVKLQAQATSPTRLNPSPQLTAHVGAQKQIERLVPPVKAWAAPDSLEKSQFFGNPTATILDDSGFMQYDDLRPGAYIEIRRNFVPTQGILVDLVTTDGRIHAVTLTSGGEYWVHLPEDIMFVIPGVIDTNLVLAAGNQVMPQTETQRASRLKVVRLCREIQRRIGGVYNEVGRNINRLYPIVSSSDPTQWAQLTVKEATALVDSREDPPAILLCAVHRHLMDRSLHFLAQPAAHRIFHTFDVRPRGDIELIALINEWIVSKSPQFESFVKKAKDIIRKTSAHRKIKDFGTFTLVPKEDLGPLPTFDSNDRKFISFLLKAIKQKRSIQHDVYRVAAIIKAIGLKDEEVGASTIHTLLIDMGVLPPWDDPMVRDRHMVINPHDIAPKGALSSAAAVKKKDELASQRHDFGDLPVYVIDEASAEELDDGISIEPAPGHPNASWVHIHIADPTIYISPKSASAKLTETLFQTQYLVQCTIPCVSAFVRDQMSLQVASMDRPLEVMTFSALIDHTGKILEYKVRAALIRNVQKCTYSDVNYSLGVRVQRTINPFVTEQTETPIKILGPDQSRDLAELHKISRALRDERFQSGVISFTIPSPTVTLTTKMPGLFDPTGITEPRIYQGMPGVKFSVSPQYHEGTASNSLVAEFMIVANRLASKFLKSHNAPGVRRSGPKVIEPSPGVIDSLLPLRDEYCAVDFIVALKHGLIQGAAQYTSTPEEHWSLGVSASDGYCRATSPLRRYVDMVNHWQIKHILAGKSVKNLPFTQKYIDEACVGWSYKERRMHRAEKNQRTYWALKYMQRWLSDQKQRNKKNPRPALFKCVVVGLIKFDGLRRSWYAPVRLPNLAMNALLYGDFGIHNLPAIGTEFPHCRVEEINLTIAPTLVMKVAS